MTATELSQFTTPCTCSNGTYGNSPTPSCHYVQMHQATANFSAPVGRRINKTPRKIALLDTGAGVQYYPHTAQPLRVLDGYLQNAGLYKSGSVDNTDSGGCPANSTAGCTLNGGRPGIIYDQFNSYEDLKSTGSYPHGLLNALDSGGQLIYRTFWTPHWDVSNSIANRIYTGSDCTVGGQPQCQGSGNYTTIAPWPPSPDPRLSAMSNVAYFLGQRGTGLMSECSAIENYEGTRTVTPASTQTNFLFSGPIIENGIGGNFDGRNCTDPDYLALGGTRPNCVFYQHVDSPFGQIGDFHYVTQGGAVSSFGPAPAAGASPATTYNGGIARMMIGWNNYQTTSNVPAAIPAPGSPNGWDTFDFGFVGNNTLNGAVIYIGGHEQMQSTVGNRLVLNTLMNLDYEPVGRERALSAPIAFIDNNPGTSDITGTKSLLFAGTYLAISGYPGDPSYASFRYEQGSHWIYPYVSGHFRTHSLIGGSTLAAGESDLFQFTLWDAANQMTATSPAARNVFTYFGGYVATGQPGLHGVRQIGWVPEVVSGVALPSNCPSSPCVDVVKWANVGGTLALVPGSDGICDLQQALGTTPVDLTSTLTGACGTANQANLAADLPKAQSMLQTVLGYCFSTTSGVDAPLSGTNQPRLTPTLSQCNGPNAVNTPKLGGIVHSTPAVVPPSVNIDLGTRKRPTVAYVGTYDGQLHAFYVSGGANYTGPSTTVSLPPGNLTANSPRAGTTSGNVFATNWASLFAAGTTPAAGTELWSFIPSTQLAGLNGNNARVDASPVYMDVFIDIAGTNQREWHTVLIGSVGPTGNEIFAMDITNPLQPVLMWDIVGSTYLWGPSYPPLSVAVLANDSTGGLFDTKWVNTTSYYRFAPAADPGRSTTGLYDYTDLGGSVGISLGQMRAGLAPVFGVFLATNASGSAAGGISRGLEVLALDIATGQKLWQFEQPYSQAWVPNGVPPVASLLAGPDGVNRIYVGDQEGRLWELDASTGVNINNANSICASPPCNYAAFDTGSTSINPQPITTNIGIAKIPQNPDLGSDFVAFAGNTVLLFGTAGANWVPATVSGTIHVPFLDTVLRVPIYTGGWNLPHTINWTAPQAQTFAGTYGVLQELGPGLPHTFAVGERCDYNCGLHCIFRHRQRPGPHRYHAPGRPYHRSQLLDRSPVRQPCRPDRHARGAELCKLRRYDGVSQRQHRLRRRDRAGSQQDQQDHGHLGTLCSEPGTEPHRARWSHLLSKTLDAEVLPVRGLQRCEAPPETWRSAVSPCSSR